jgi:hypothetical protein
MKRKQKSSLVTSLGRLVEGLREAIGPQPQPILRPIPVRTKRPAPPQN